jgi:UDP-2-acetamido-2,6-beta-L-arabino-hexul-4-ose reductase
MKVLVTGANGFLGTHLVNALLKKPDIEVTKYNRNDNIESLHEKLINADFIFHLAGTNRPKYNDEFIFSNVKLTENITNFLNKFNIKSPIYFSSSIQVLSNHPYGVSKLEAEILLKKLSEKNGNKVFIDRLPGIFGQGARPHYNSVVATFCNNIIHGEKIELLNPDKVIKLLYIEDLIESLLKTLLNFWKLSSQN